MFARTLLLLVAGACFGFGLAFSGMTNPARVVDFLDLAGNWDPTLMFVMAGALGTYGVGMAIFRRAKDGRGWFGTRLPYACVLSIDWRLLAGATVFGIGWGLGGICPGPALANLAAWRTEALVFVPAMIAGMFIAQRLLSADRD
jgi:uncharacterized membrane protein YedE/YeeE